MTNQDIITWFNALVEGVRSEEEDLSARQMAIFFSIYIKNNPQTVRGLAKNLNISKPAVSRAVDFLSSLEYVRRIEDSADKRSIVIQRTVKGSIYFDKLRDRLGIKRTIVE